MRARIALLFAAAVLTVGCASFAPDKPVRPTLYDLGVGPAATTAAPTGAPLVLADIESGGAFDGTALLYRLGYADAHQLRPYAFARWSAPPAQLVRQRLREHLGNEQPVIDQGSAAALARRGGQVARVLRIELEEFSHVFDTQQQSKGLVRLRCTLLENTPGGERLIAQRSFSTERAAPTPDAPGGVRGLAAATDAAAADIALWLRQAR